MRQSLTNGVLHRVGAKRGGQVWVSGAALYETCTACATPHHPKGGKMPGASPQSHDASRWGSSKMGTSSRWHHERAPHLSQFLNPPPSPPTQWVDNPPHSSHVEDSLLKRRTNTYTRKYQLAYSLSLHGTPQPPKESLLGQLISWDGATIGHPTRRKKVVLMAGFIRTSQEPTHSRSDNFTESTPMPLIRVELVAFASTLILTALNGSFVVFAFSVSSSHSI